MNVNGGKCGGLRTTFASVSSGPGTLFFTKCVISRFASYYHTCKSVFSVILIFGTLLAPPSTSTTHPHRIRKRGDTMARTKLMLLFTFSSCLVVVGRTMIGGGVSAKNAPASNYFPYPPGIIPSDLVPEIDRVNRELNLIESEALAQWHALPINSGTAMRQVQILGKIELFDKNLSVNKNQACSFCHMPYAGFSGPIPSVNLTTVAYPGSSHFRFGKRKPNSYTYSPFFPVLQYNKTQANFYGGNFWDARATGYLLQSADAEQAQDPLSDPLEMGITHSACIVRRLSLSA